MILHPPFSIGPRLMPALMISDSNGSGWLSFCPDRCQFVIDLPGGDEHWITDYKPGLGARSSLPAQFGDILSFLGACAESRAHDLRYGRPDEIDDDGNSSLFPANVGAWAQQMSGEIDMLRFEIEESDKELIAL